MPEPLVAGLPPDMDLPDGYIVRFNALDQTSGAQVAGVIVKNVSIYGTPLGAGTTTTETTGPFMLVAGPAA